MIEEGIIRTDHNINLDNQKKRGYQDDQHVTVISDDKI